MNENEYLSNQMRYIVLTVQTNSLKINKSGTKKDKYNLINELQNKYMIYKIIIKQKINNKIKNIIKNQPKGLMLSNI